MLVDDMLALQRVVARFEAASPEDQAAFLHIMERIADAGMPDSDAELARVGLEAARETGNAKLIRRAEARFARFKH